MDTNQSSVTTQFCMDNDFIGLQRGKNNWIKNKFRSSNESQNHTSIATGNTPLWLYIGHATIDFMIG